MMQKHRDLLLVTLAIVVATGTLIVAILLWPYPQASGETPRSSTGGTYTDVTALQLAELLRQKDFMLINTHIPYEGELPATDAFIPFDQIAQIQDRLPVDKAAKIVLYCRSGRMSMTAAQTLVGLGYTHVMNLTGGMNAWQDAGFSVSKDHKRK